MRGSERESSCCSWVRAGSHPFERPGQIFAGRMCETCFSSQRSVCVCI